VPEASETHANVNGYTPGPLNSFALNQPFEAGDQTVELVDNGSHR